MWRSILVDFFIFEGGAKNPSKGTSMKFLMIASDAQSGAFVGNKKQGAIRNGMWALPSLHGESDFIRYKPARINNCSVACLEWKR